MWHVTDRVNVYANYGRGSRRRRSSSLPMARWARAQFRAAALGQQFGRDRAQGAHGTDQRVNLAAFDIRRPTRSSSTRLTAAARRTKNATKTERKGVEAAWQGNLGGGFAGYASYTYLSAKFTDAATTGVPPRIVPAGARLPGVPGTSAYGELSWSYPQAGGLNAALEVQYAGNVYVNDRNTDAAPAWTTASLRVGFEQTARRRCSANSRASTTSRTSTTSAPSSLAIQRRLLRAVRDAQFPDWRERLCKPV